jgi:GH15 family glucan-1,4-alpha-glucosidase
MLVAFDCRYSIRDFYYPHVGQENHAGGPFRFGIWVDGALSWVHDDGWARSLSYEEDTLVTRAELRNSALQIEMSCSDAVDFHLNVYLKCVIVRNLSPVERVARLYFHQNFTILGNDAGDTAYFDPTTRAMIHYKRDRYFLANCCGPESCGINSFATGAKGQPGFEGTFRDIEFIKPLYRPLIISIADFLAKYRDDASGLPLPSWDLWEERSGIHAFTCGAVFGGLAAARDCARMFGQEEKASEYSAALTQLHRGMDELTRCAPAARSTSSSQRALEGRLTGNSPRICHRRNPG